MDILSSLVNVNDRPFINYVLDDLKGFDITLVCSNLNYEYFKYYRSIGVEVINEGVPCGTGGFLMKMGENIPGFILYNEWRYLFYWRFKFRCR